MGFQVQAWAWQRPDGKWIVGWGRAADGGPDDKLPAAHDTKEDAERVVHTMNRAFAVVGVQ